MTIPSINPANYEVIGEQEVTTDGEIVKKVALANSVKEQWGSLPIEERIEHVKRLRAVLKKHESEIAELITKEVGTPITECRDEVAWDWGYYDWFVDNAAQYLSKEVSFEDETSVHEVFHEPVGLVAAITPWNLPFDMFVWAVIPNLLAGNVVIHKASEECILTGKLLADLVEEAGLPEGVFQAIHGDGTQGQVLVSQAIDMIWFTGSYEVGHSLYKTAADKFIKIVLELGGSNPSIVLEDADVDALLGSLMFKRFSFCGQTCDALKRLIVHESKVDDVVAKMSQAIKELKVGNPNDSSTHMGPLVSKKQMELLSSQVQDALDSGAEILAQGTFEGSGAYYAPILLGNVTPDMRIWKEEVFGPVLPIVSFETDEEAIALANATEYGLGSQVFSTNTERASQLARKIKAGNVDINGVGHFKPSSPFGGYKLSGLGREHGKYGFHEVSQVKLIARPK